MMNFFWSSFFHPVNMQDSIQSYQGENSEDLDQLASQGSGSAGMIGIITVFKTEYNWVQRDKG